MMDKKIISFIETLRLSSGSYVGKPFRLREWQKDMITDVYGPVDKKGLRIVRTALLTIGRKNGKSEFCAALALAHSCLRGLTIPNQQIVIIASEREQASLMYRMIAAFIRQDSELSSLFNVVDSRKTIEYKSNHGTIKVFPAVASALHGLNPSVVFADEAGNWSGEKGREIYNVLSTGFGAQDEPLMWILSTQANSETHFFTELVRYAESVNSGNIKDSTFKGFVFTVPEDANVFDMDVMKQANPALGDFRSLKDLQVTAERAAKMPANEAQYRQLFANQIVNTLSTFVSPSLWKENGSTPEPVNKRCWIGFDLSGRNDLTAMVVIVPDDDGFIDVLPYFWKPEDSLHEHGMRDKVPYEMWAKEGYLETTPGSTVDYEWVVHRAAQILQHYDVQVIGYDRWRIEDFQREMDKQGLYWDMKPIGQGFKDFSLVIDDFEELLLSKKIRHGNHPVLTWNAANCVIDIDPAGGRKFSKQKSYSRIDGMVALGMAIRVWKMEEAAGYTIENGVLFI